MIKRTLYFSNPVYLSVKNKQLQIESREPDKNTALSTIHIEDIGFVILDNQQIIITQRVLQLLHANNCAVMVCDDRHLPTSLLLTLSGNTLQSERYTEQINASVSLKKQLWQQTIIAKIKNQAYLLKSQGVEISNMLQWAKVVTSGDVKNHEARAAAYYWENIFNQNEKFRRERFGEMPNNLLNYGYAVLRAVVARSIVGSGLLPSLGIHHHNRYNAFCLADDIMEPYRPFVDKVVLEIVNSYEFEIEELGSLPPAIKKKLLIIPALDVIIDNEKSPLMIATQRTTASLSKCFRGEVRKVLYPEMI